MDLVDAMISLRPIFLLILFPIVLCACRQTEETPSSATPENVPAHTERLDGISGTLAFECREEKTFTLSITEDGESAVLQREEGSPALERIPAETGARFGSDGVEVWLADSEGAFIVEDGVMTYQDCVRVGNE